MAYGINLNIANGTSQQAPIPSGFQFPTLAVLNPNDGVIYVSANDPVASPSPGSWDWKIPSQSYAALPGSPQWLNFSMYYLDQSGSGHSGEITIYPLQQAINAPIFQSVGRALVSVESALDITEGTTPANPGANILRLWADAADHLHRINSTGVDALIVDYLVPLGGVLAGFLPNPTFGSKVITAAAVADNTLTNSQLAGGTALANLLDGSLTFNKLAANAATLLGFAGGAVGSSTTSGAFVDAPEGSISITTVGGPIFCWFQASMQCNVASTFCDVAVNLDGSDFIVGRVSPVSINQDFHIGGMIPLIGVAAGAHTIKARYRTSGGALAVDSVANSYIAAIELRR